MFGVGFGSKSGSGIQWVAVALLLCHGLGGESSLTLVQAEDSPLEDCG